MSRVPGSKNVTFRAEIDLATGKNDRHLRGKTVVFAGGFSKMRGKSAEKLGHFSRVKLLILKEIQELVRSYGLMAAQEDWVCPARPPSAQLWKMSDGP